MERDRYNPYHFESSEEKSDDKKEEKKKKSATGLAKLLAGEEAPKESDKSDKKEEPTVWQKLTGEMPDGDAEQNQDGAESDEAPPLESLNQEEQARTAQAYIEERAKELSAEVDQTNQLPEQIAETEADASFLTALHERLGAQDDAETIDEAIDEAFDETVAELAIGENADEEPVTSPEPGSEEAITEAEQPGPQEFSQDQAVPLAGSSGRGGRSSMLPGMPPMGDGMPASENPRRPGFAATATGGERLYTAADVQRFERTATGRGVLVGGILGYLIGRRRGRINTEKRLKSVQTKLEKQVVDIQQKIEQKEQTIRKLAREKVVVAARVETIAKPQRATETRPTAQSERPTAAETVLPVNEALKSPVDSLSKNELLAFSAQIKVGETNLRRVYEANMVDEKGLRRLIKEYQAGHDLRRALAREFLVKELKFERDPTLRDLLPPETQPRKQGQRNSSGSQHGEGAVGAVNDLAAQVAMGNQQSSDTRQSARANAKQQPARRTQAPVSPSLLIGLSLLTILLALYAIWLTVSK